MILVFDGWYGDLPHTRPHAPSSVTLAEYEGHPYISLRVWARGDDGAWWPCKGRGCSVRLGEVAALVEALGRIGEGEGPRRNGATWGQQRPPAPAPPRSAQAGAGAHATGRGDRSPGRAGGASREPRGAARGGLPLESPDIDFDEFGA